jgi:hypothetical protein
VKKVISLRYVLLLIVLTIVLVLPLVFINLNVSAEGNVYAFVKVPSGISDENLKSSVDMLFDATANGENVYAIIRCSQEQLNRLIADGYVIEKTLTGEEESCLSGLSQTLKSYTQ